jgi:hypothetical protein
MKWRLFLAVFGIFLAPIFAGAQDVCIKTLQGEEREACLREVSDFYNAYYRKPPYYYDSSEEAWDRYLRSFTNESESILCVAIVDERVIGAIIGTPLAKTTQKYKGAFLDRPEDLYSLFFLGELSVKSEYQYDVNKALYDEFERQVAEKNQFSGTCVWQLQSEINKPSGLLWREMGFECSEVQFEELWKDTFGTEKVPHSMVSWKKRL